MINSQTLDVNYIFGKIAREHPKSLSGAFGPQPVIPARSGFQLNPRHENCLARLSRIEGQVRGVSKMIEEDRYCIDILTQLRAIKAALHKVESEVLKGHADHCIAQAIKGGGAKQQKEKFNELINLFERYSR